MIINKLIEAIVKRKHIWWRGALAIVVAVAVLHLTVAWTHFTTPDRLEQTHNGGN